MKRFLPGCLCLLIAVLPAFAQSDAQKKATIAYLQKLQTEDGGFRFDTRPNPKGKGSPKGRAVQSTLPATTSAYRALKYFGGAPRDREACTAFVVKCFDKEGGGFGTEPGGKVAWLATAVGIMAVVDMKMPTEPYAEAVTKYLDEHSKSFEEIRLAAASFEALGTQPPHADAWLEQIAKLRNSDGTYGKDGNVARDTGGAVCAVLRLGGKVEQPENVLKALNAGQRKDGGFGQPGTIGQRGVLDPSGVAGSDLATTYRVVRAFHMLKAKPQGADRLREFIARCRNEDGGYGVAPGEPSNVSGCYYAGIILHWLDEQ
jgi:prenyltransferase beta subunit